MKSSALALWLCVLPLASAAETSWPALKYTVDPEWPRLPTGWTFEETPGVAVDAREHVFVFHRGPHPLNWRVQKFVPR